MLAEAQDLQLSCIVVDGHVHVKNTLQQIKPALAVQHMCGTSAITRTQNAAAGSRDSVHSIGSFLCLLDI